MLLSATADGRSGWAKWRSVISSATSVREAGAITVRSRNGNRHAGRNRWQAAYYNRTPLLSGSNNLYGGFTYKAGAGKVIVSNEVKYAPIHNNGGVVTHRITPRMRRYAWHRFFEAAGIKKGDSPKVRKRKESAMNPADWMWKRLALTPKQTSRVHIPQRKFMGHSKELQQKINEYTEKELKKLIGDF